MTGPGATASPTTSPTSVIGPTPSGPTNPEGLATPSPTSPTAGYPALRVTDVTAAAARVSWNAAPNATYMVALGDRALGAVGVTAVRLVGLRPATDYTFQISVRGPDGSLVPHTMPVAF